MDSVLLRALDRGFVDGPSLFTRLLLGNPPQRVLRFLDGNTSVLEELAIMRATPTLAMARATVGNTVDRPGKSSTSSKVRASGIEPSFIPASHSRIGRP